MRPWQDTTLPTSRRAELLLQELTLEEKAAQLGSYWDDRRDTGEVIAPMQDVFAKGRPTFEEAVANGIGHLTRVFGTTPVEPDEGAAKLASFQNTVRSASRLGIPAIAHEECLTGFTALGATVYPAPLAWGASFNPALVQEVGAAVGSDLSAAGVHQGLAPVLDVTRDYRWGRTEETIGEDPYLVGTIGSAYARGLEAAGVIATLKHLVGYSASNGGRNHAPVAAGPREVADVLLPPFEHAVRTAGVRSVMNSYSAIDGVPAAADERLLTGLLREAWGFAGTVVSDYWAVPFLKSKQGVVDSVEGAAAAALAAGMDVELPDTGAYGRLPELVRSGRLPEELVDRAALRVLTQKVELGLLDEGWSPEPQGPVNLDSQRNRDLARRLAEESVVLLENRAGALPLVAPKRLALIGPVADDVRSMLGCYSYPNHVLPRHPEIGLGIPVTPLGDALAQEFPGATISVAEGVPLLDDDRSGIDEALELARAADVVVAVVGDRAGMFGKGTSGEGCDAPDVNLPGIQGELLDALLDTGKEVVVLVISGRPYVLEPYRDRAAALVQAFMPGAEGAAAIAGVLSGRVNPSGHLPVQVPRSSAGMPHTYLNPLLGHDGDRISNISVTPSFAFGHGLSYASFQLGALDLDRAEIQPDGELLAHVTVKNTGTVPGATVVQLYATDPAATVTRPVIELIGYARVHLAPGEQVTVGFRIHADRFSFTGINLERIVEPGRVVLSAGLASDNRPAIAELQIIGTTRTVPEGRVLTTEATLVH